MTSSLWNWLLFTLIQRDKVKWVCVTLNEGYLRSANRGSNNFYRFLIKIYQISLQWKDKFFWSVFFNVDLRIYCGYFLAICQLCLNFVAFLSLTAITGQRNFLALGEGLLDKIFETKIGFQLSFTSNLKIWCF